MSLALGTNRDLFDSGSLSEGFYREMKHSGAFNIVFEASRNQAGYSRDVHGQLNVIQNAKQSGHGALLGPSSQVKNVKFRLQENRVELFDHFVI